MREEGAAVSGRNFDRLAVGPPDMAGGETIVPERAGSGGGGHTVFFAEDDAGVLGLIAVGAPEGGVFGRRGAIRELYVGPRDRGSDLAAALLGRGRDALARLGWTGAALVVDAADSRARAFCAREGGREAATFADWGRGGRIDRVLIAWDDPPGRLP